MKANLLPQSPKYYAKNIRVRGIVQDVEFRSTVWKLAHQFQLVGTVSNDGDGVLIKVEGKSYSINEFIEALNNDKPILALIDSIERQRSNYPNETVMLPTMPKRNFLCPI